MPRIVFEDKIEGFLSDNWEGFIEYVSQGYEESVGEPLGFEHPVLRGWIMCVEIGDMNDRDHTAPVRLVAPGQSGMHSLGMVWSWANA